MTENYILFSDAKENLLPEIPNAVGYLQELCVKKQLNPPIYGILRQEGPSHRPVFSTFCRVGDHYRVAMSTNKKKGKECAAREIILCLRACKWRQSFCCKSFQFDQCGNCILF